MIGILNAHMFGQATEPGEHVDWSEPDVMTEEEWEQVLGMSIADYAVTAPWMIVWEIES
jgi:hypothetical protein